MVLVQSGGGIFAWPWLCSALGMRGSLRAGPWGLLRCLDCLVMEKNLGYPTPKGRAVHKRHLLPAPTVRALLVPGDELSREVSSTRISCSLGRAPGTGPSPNRRMLFSWWSIWLPVCYCRVRSHTLALLLLSSRQKCLNILARELLKGLHRGWKRCVGSPPFKCLGNKCTAQPKVPPNMFPICVAVLAFGVSK